MTNELAEIMQELKKELKDNFRQIVREEIVRVVPTAYTLKQTADILNLSVGTLRNMRSRGEGPRYSREPGKKTTYTAQAIFEYLGISQSEAES